MFLFYLLTHCPSCQRQLGQQQILSISGGLEPLSVRFPMNVPWLSPLPQQYVSMSSLDARVFCVPLVSIRLLAITAVPSLHFSSARGPARGAVVTRSHNPGSDVPAAVSVTQKNTFSWVRKKIIKNQKVTFMFSKEAQSII